MNSGLSLPFSAKLNTSKRRHMLKALLTLPRCWFSGSSCWGSMPGSDHHFGQQKGENLLLQRELRGQNLATILWQEWSFPRLPVLLEIKYDSPAQTAQAVGYETDGIDTSDITKTINRQRNEKLTCPSPNNSQTFIQRRHKLLFCCVFRKRI